MKHEIVNFVVGEHGEIQRNSLYLAMQDFFLLSLFWARYSVVEGKIGTFSNIYISASL